MYYKNRNSDHSFTTIYFFIIYLMYIGSITLSPFEFSLLTFKKYFTCSFSRRLELFFQLNVLDFFFNIILFIPLGIFLFFLFKKYIRNRKTDFYLPIAAGILLSSSIEIIQIFTGRFTSFWDLLSNIIGTLLGFKVMKNTFFRDKIFTGMQRIWSKRILRVSVMIIYIFFIFILFFYPYHANTMKNWDHSYPLLLGNEATLDRAWKGEIFSVAIYNQRLSPDKVKQLFNRGSKDNSIQSRDEMGLILFYSFNEGLGNIINDMINKDNPVHLKAKNIEWINKQGIRIDSTSKVRSYTSTDKLISRLQSTSEVSIEVWFRTLDLNQIGPVRIVSLSKNTEKRNFTLALNKDNIHLRVRTPVTGVNGTKINLVAPSVLSDIRLHHIIAVFDHGTERIFFDGKPTRDLVRADIDYLPFMLRLGKTWFSRICFCFLFFLPLGFLISQAFSKFSLIITVFIVILIVGFEQYFYHIFTGQSFGIELFIYGVIFSVMGELPDRLSIFNYGDN